MDIQNVLLEATGTFVDVEWEKFERQAWNLEVGWYLDRILPCSSPTL